MAKNSRASKPNATSAPDVHIFTYVIEHDLGFAPNPFHGFCTLACCKPKIRSTAAVGDYILGFGAAKPGISGKLSYWMLIERILSFDQYWSDPRYWRKRPCMLGTTYLRYGDNIYHHERGNNDFRQEDSFHSEKNGVLSFGNLKRDTGTTQNVLIASEFAYWGKSAITLPDGLNRFIIRGPGHKSRFTQSEIAAFLAWLKNRPERGYLDEPAHWQFLDSPRHRRRAA